MRMAYRSLLCSLVLGLVVASQPVAAAPPRQTTGDLNAGSLLAMAIDDSGNGWGWTAGTSAKDVNHLLRLENGQWTDVKGAAMARQTGALYGIVVTAQGDGGWAIGISGGKPIVWKLSGTTWTQTPTDLPADTLLDDVTISADGRVGLLLGSSQKTLAPVLRELENGKWVAARMPNDVDLRVVTLSPDGKHGWGIGERSRARAETVAVEWADGDWLDFPPDLLFAVPHLATKPAVDNKGDGWTHGPPIEPTLVRLTHGAYPRTVPLQFARTLGSSTPFQPTELDSLAVDGFGRGWLTGLATLPSAGGTTTYAVAAHLDGDTVTDVPLDGVEPTRNNAPKIWVGPLAVSPGGGHTWLAASTDYYNPRFLGELREAWTHADPPAADPLPGRGHCFAEVPHCLRGVLARFWETHGGLNQLGYPITPEVIERLGGSVYIVQYTQRARLEYHPENRPPYDVLLGLLGNTLVGDRTGGPFAPVPSTVQTGVQWFAPTRHSVGPPFLAYWQANGGLPVFGLPRSEAFDEKNAADGKTYRVQYFERNRLEYHPENAGTRFEMLLGLLGVEQFNKTFGYTP
jgi:hypothetical protein